jgi:hypothetical protein
MLLLAISHGKSTTGGGIILDSLDENKIRDRELLENHQSSANVQQVVVETLQYLLLLV